MKNLLNYTALCLATLMFATSCKKKETTTPEEDPVINQPGYNNANAVALLSNLATPLQSYTISASGYNTFVCSNGTSIITYPNAFLTQSGGPVTGVINIQVKDVLSKKAMILNNAIPVSNGQLLVSGGEVYINATQGSQKLKINPASSVYINVPVSGAPSNSMLEFYAQGSSDLSNTNLNWATGTASTTIAVIQDSVSGPAFNYYSFECDSVNWTNCDYFYNLGGAKTTCTVNLTGSFDNSNSVVFISMNGVNALARLSSGYSSLSQAFVSYTNSLPEGVTYTVVAISFDGTNYYYGSQAVTMSTNLVVSMPPLTQTTKAQIETNLSTLP